MRVLWVGCVWSLGCFPLRRFLSLSALLAFFAWCSACQVIVSVPSFFSAGRPLRCLRALASPCSSCRPSPLRFACCSWSSLSWSAGVLGRRRCCSVSLRILDGYGCSRYVCCRLAGGGPPFRKKKNVFVSVGGCFFLGRGAGCGCLVLGSGYSCGGICCLRSPSAQKKYGARLPRRRAHSRKKKGGGGKKKRAACLGSAVRSALVCPFFSRVYVRRIVREKKVLPRPCPLGTKIFGFFPR